MSDSPPPHDEPAAAAPPSSPRRARHRWLPIITVLAAAFVWFGVRQSDMTDDFQNVLSTNAVLLAAVVLSLWYLFCGGRPLVGRLLLTGVPWLLAVALLAIVQPVYNGDLAVVGWRWRFARDADELVQVSAASTVIDDWQTTPQDYPRFLGTGYWAEVGGVTLQTDWQVHPPQEVWRREIGAGWSAFAVVGNYAITQEQRGELEQVSCYRVSDGELMWVHSDTSRFDPDGAFARLGGVGPRATPTVHDGKVFTQGATGRVDCLDARTGNVVWSHDTLAETGASLTTWGKSGSPLVVDDIVVVSIGAPSDAAALDGYASSLVAYDVATGEVRWAAGSRQASYASPVVATLAGERQILIMNEGYITAHRATDGAVLWEHPFAGQGDENASASQPVPVGNDRVFLSKGYGVGASLLEVAQNAAGQFTARPLWSPPVKPVMKTKFGNVLIRDGAVYGLDGVLLECMDLESGRVHWKKRRQPPFGHGQIMLVGSVILVLTESGELVAVEASPDEYRELASVPVLNPDNVTWNNLAFSTPYLLVRNAREAACYRLPVTE